MAGQRKQKKQRKQAKRKKDRSRSKDRTLRYEKADEYVWEADWHYRQKRYQKAYEWAMKGLRVSPKHKGCYHYAWVAADKLEDREPLFKALSHGLKHCLIEERQHLYVLAYLAYGRQDLTFAKEVFQAFLANPDKIPQARDLKKQLKQAEYMLEFCDNSPPYTAAAKTSRSSKKGPSSKKAARKSSATQSSKVKRSVVSESQAEKAPSQEEIRESSRTQPEQDVPNLEIVYELEADAVLEVIDKRQLTDLSMLELALNAYKFSFRTSYDQLICLPALHNVESLWYQEETARKVMRTLRGRAILADEVGLGKTIEASLVLKEYILRGLVKTALVLVPSSLVNQWHEELLTKFGLEFITSNDPMFREDPETFWKQPLLLVSLQTARMKKYADAVTARMYDMVIVDEAHHLKNRTTLNWKLINGIQKTFLLLLTATPVQNKLEELYNLVTLLKPGHLKTRKAFMEEFVARGNPTDPRNREKLRELLKEVMVRNTRSVAQLRLPPRFAFTLQVEPDPHEVAFYHQLSQFVARQASNGAKGLSRMVLRRLLEAAGSSHFAALRMLENMHVKDQKKAELLTLGKQIKTSTKVERMLELLRASPEQKIIFVNYLQTLEYLQKTLKKCRITHVVYRGGMTPLQKQAVMQQFQQGCPVLLATDTGGEGHNLQFCHTMINYDLPWNPMRIEQRIGRIHRFGQEHEVHVHNFCALGSIEEYILEILDRKINMFELVVGEIDMILGRLQGEQEFSDMVYDLWIKHTDEADRKRAFQTFGTRLKRAKTAYEKSKELDEKLFQEDFGV